MFVFCMTLTFVTVLILAKPNFTATLMQWFSNLVIAAPAIGEPYMDGAYWSLLIEVVFYARFAVLIALGWFPRRIDMIILIWIGITFANELTLDLHIIESCSSRMTAASLLSASSNTNSIAIGGLTYPFYLLHMQMVYVIYSSDLVGPKTPATVVAIIVSIAVLSWAIWRYIEGPLHNWTKRILAKAVQNTYANERSHTQSDRP